MNKITPCLWFDGRAEEAMNFYISLFKNTKVLQISRYGEGAPFAKGTALVCKFELEGKAYMALNGGPHYSFTPAISLMIDCNGQVEVDYYWENFTKDGGIPSRCGWLTDKFGVSWQIVPKRLVELMSDKDPAKSSRVMQAMFKMSKIIIADLEAAYNA